MDNTNNNVRSSNIRLSTVATTTRQTPKTDFGSVMRAGLVKAGNVAIEGLRVAAPFVPGGAIVSAALAGANAAAGMPGPQYATPMAGNAGGGAFGSTSSALTGAAGPTASGGASIGGATASGALAIPGRRPNLGTTTGASPSSFAGNAGGTATNSAGDSFNQMMAATREMSEFQASFNLQYLQLQEKIQTDTRQFNLISNIMKTKHDAAKTALNNVR